jgi:hypothetical protein
MSEFRKNLKRLNGGKDIDWDNEISKMSNESQITAKDYIKNMVEPQAAFTESYFDEN